MKIKLTNKMMSFALVFFAFIFVFVANAEITKLPPEAKKVLLTQQPASLIISTSDIPSSVMAVCKAKYGSGEDFNLANPKEKFQVTDVIMEKGLPRRRLIWATALSSYFILHYESGGYAHSFHVLIFSLENKNKAELVWAGVADRSYSSYNDFLKDLNNNKLSDSLDYSH